jgi:hypothetical protein
VHHSGTFAVTPPARFARNLPSPGGGKRWRPGATTHLVEGARDAARRQGRSRSLSSSRSRTGRRPKPGASQRPSAPSSNTTDRRWRTRRRTVQSDGDGKTQTGDVESSDRAIHHAKLRRAKLRRAKLRRAKPHHAPLRRAIRYRRAIHLAPAPELRSMQRRLRPPLRDKPISTYSWRAPTTTSPYATRYRQVELFHERRIKFRDRRDG